MKSCCDANDTSCRESYLSVNHAVAIVGYSDGDGKSTKTVTKCKVDNWWVTCKTEEVENNSGGADAQGDNNYWKLQNSWGTGWGDEGFIKFEIRDEEGVCRINDNGIHWATWDFDS